MSKRYLSTGEAAEFCSVTRDTIFKWIRAGHLPAHRTAGGHHRIAVGDLEQFATSRGKLETETQFGNEPAPSRYCWEFHGGGDILEGCRRCGVYLLRAHRCYEWFLLGPDIGEVGIYCRENCTDCDYYSAVHSQNTNVLVLSDDSKLIRCLSEDSRKADFNLRTAQCGYDCSMLVSSFRPDFVFIDCSLGYKEAKNVIEHLVRDPRIPFVRVIVAGHEGGFPEDCEKGVFGRIERPFGIEEISEFIGSTRISREEVSVEESHSH